MILMKTSAGCLRSARLLLAATAISVLAQFSPVMAQDPIPGGTLHLPAPYSSALKSLDPHITYESQDMAVSKAFHRALYTWDSAENRPALDLATSVETSADGKTFTYKLRDNAYFHNGRKMTADDLIWSYTRIMDPAKGYPGSPMISEIVGAEDYAAGKATSISGLKKVDDFTLEITFKNYLEPGTLLFEAVTAILPKEEADKPEFLSHPIGLGPFRFVEHVEGSRVVGEKFDKYYKPGQPYADRVEFTITDEYSALDVAFRAGELDATVLSGGAYAAYKADPELSKGLIEVAELFTRHMGMNVQKPPFDDVRVRQAINYAVDRDIIIRKLLKDKAFKATGWLPMTSVAFDKDRKPYAYDPEKAKQLLKEAGYGDGFEFEAMVTDGESSLGVLQAMMPFLSAVGINAKPKVVESGVLLDAINAGEAMAWFRSNGTGPDPVGALRCFDSRVSRSACNRSGYADPKFDVMIDAASSDPDPKRRIELAKEADGYIFEQAPVWFHNYNKAVVATQPWVHGVDSNVTEAAILEVDQIWLDENAPGRN